MSKKITIEEAAELERERDAWKDSAAQFLRNQEFYQGIVKQVGETFGVAARTSDNGSIKEDVLALKVPELVAELHAQLTAANERLRVVEGERDRAVNDAKSERQAKDVSNFLTITKAEWQHYQELATANKALTAELTFSSGAMREIADELAALRTQNERLREACKSLIDCEHQEHFAARLNDAEMVGIEKIKAALTLDAGGRG